jgi:biopolymer transport protein ExbD
MKLQRRHKEGAEVSTESLNDIMFFLLLFFLILSTLANPNVIKLTLPSSKPAEQMVKQRITLQVSADHEYAINDTKIPFTDLEAALKFKMEQLNEPTIVLSLDKSLSIQDLADVMQIGANLKAKMVLSTKSTSK